MIRVLSIPRLAYLIPRVEPVAADILASPEMRSEEGFVQHGDTSCFEHSLSVALTSLALCGRFHLTVDERSLIRGALLHDFFLYDWHAPDPSHRLHAFTHPGAALRNARRCFELTPVEEDIIAKHMFPLTPALPRYRESVVVLIADKICAVLELNCFPFTALRKREGKRYENA